MIKAIGVLVSSLLASHCMAAYNANMQGEVSSIYNYAEGDYVFITLKNQPTTHPTCNPSYFSIDGSIPPDRRKAMIARVMLAYATHEVITIGYDKDSTCSEGVIRVYRVG